MFLLALVYLLLYPVYPATDFFGGVTRLNLFIGRLYYVSHGLNQRTVCSPQWKALRYPSVRPQVGPEHCLGHPNH